MTWAAEEFAGAQLGDAHSNHRLIKLTQRFADKPTASIPGACPDWIETQGAYRFFDQANNAKRPVNRNFPLENPQGEETGENRAGKSKV
ncbi:IS4/Tn5 family transposase DNA-binding protein [Verminephrobacter eiseniae]|uniref:IS4/Tn5 family transposase DNA-binding protein n=1 Tax=Verminephrobacter eiseniae TaxID=364317 RepID=UPI0022380D93|nr:transposase [Verminephrobacter eiseniae]